MLTEGPKFFLSSFKHAININMNAAMAIQLYKLITESPSEKVGKELYAFTEKLKNQLYHLKHLGDLENAIGISPSESRSDNTGASEVAA